MTDLEVRPTPLEGALIITPRVFADERGFFYESWNQQRFNAAIGRQVSFVQDNHSRSTQGVVRGLHYQNPRAQAKLVRCVAGAVWDVIVDLRRSSATYGEWFELELSESEPAQLWVPEGFAHGFLTLSPTADVLYKTSDYYDPEAEHTLRWDDPSLAIEWPLGDLAPVVSLKDAQGHDLADTHSFV